MNKRLKVSFVPFSNFGDTCVPYILKKLDIPFVFCHHTVHKKMTMIGSVIQGSSKPNTAVWGPGLMHAKDDANRNANYIAVRGPRTLQRLNDLGIDCSKTVIGDPAILLPKVYQPKVEKKYKLGIIPHMIDGHVIRYIRENKDRFPNTKVIDANTKVSQIEGFIDQVNSCEKILSTCLHGIICAHAYNVPVKWMRVGDGLMGDDVKFHDHFESLNLSLSELNMPIDLIKDENVEVEPTNHIDTLNKNADNLWAVRPWPNLSDDYYVDLDNEEWTKECYPENYKDKIWTDEIWNK